MLARLSIATGSPESINTSSVNKFGLPGYLVFADEWRKNFSHQLAFAGVAHKICMQACVYVCVCAWECPIKWVLLGDRVEINFARRRIYHFSRKNDTEPPIFLAPLARMRRKPHSSRAYMHTQISAYIPLTHIYYGRIFIRWRVKLYR